MKKRGEGKKDFLAWQGCRGERARPHEVWVVVSVSPSPASLVVVQRGRGEPQ